MNRWLAAAAVVATLIVSSNRVEAGGWGLRRATVVSATSATPGGFGMTGTAFAYSYYAAINGPARVYVPLNNADAFPFHGQPYGHVYDRWTWGTLQGPDPTLYRYFYPPVR